MKPNINVIFEHALDLAHSEFEYSTRDEVEYSLILQMRKAAGSYNLDEYFTEENIKHVITNIWDFKWKPIPQAIDKGCDCGAKHTTFPNYHSEWCSVLNPGRSELAMSDSIEEGILI